MKYFCLLRLDSSYLGPWLGDVCRLTTGEDERCKIVPPETVRSPPELDSTLSPLPVPSPARVLVEDQQSALIALTVRRVLAELACWPHISHICCPILVLSPTVESWAAVARPVLFWLAVPSTCHSATPGDNTLGDITHRTSGRVLTWPAEIGRLWPLLRHFSQSVRGRGGRGGEIIFMR